MDRRAFLASAAAASLPSIARPAAAGRLKQGVAATVFGPNLDFEAGCKLAASVGVQGYDFVADPKDWPTLKRYGLTLSMLGPFFQGTYPLRPPNAPAGWGAMGLKEAQGAYLDAILAAIDAAGANGFPNVIVTAGTRDRVTSAEGADNTVEFLNKAKARAEEKGVVLCMEILNSKGTAAPKNSLFDHAPWGFDVCRRVGSRSVRVLYDIWHAQLMDGNIADTIRGNIAWIGHVHTGGVPGRHEIFRDDELDYRFLAQVIAATGFKGFVTHEWTPSPGSNVAEDLKRSVEAMTV